MKLRRGYTVWCVVKMQIQYRRTVVIVLMNKMPSTRKDEISFVKKKNWFWQTLLWLKSQITNTAITV